MLPGLEERRKGVRAVASRGPCHACVMVRKPTLTPASQILVAILYQGHRSYRPSAMSTGYSRLSMDSHGKMGKPVGLPGGIEKRGVHDLEPRHSGCGGTVCDGNFALSP